MQPASFRMDSATTSSCEAAGRLAPRVSCLNLHCYTISVLNLQVLNFKLTGITEPAFPVFFLSIRVHGLLQPHLRQSGWARTSCGIHWEHLASMGAHQEGRDRSRTRYGVHSLVLRQSCLSEMHWKHSYHARQHMLERSIYQTHHLSQAHNDVEARSCCRRQLVPDSHSRQPQLGRRSVQQVLERANELW
jgi:hypothetical protein